MARTKKVVVKEEVQEEQAAEFVNNSNVTVHLDRDLNDPRLRGDTPLLPSLDDQYERG